MGLFLALKPPADVTVVASVGLMQEISDNKYGSDNYLTAGEGKLCMGDGGYDDLATGAGVTVYGASGQVVGVGIWGLVAISVTCASGRRRSRSPAATRSTPWRSLNGESYAHRPTRSTPTLIG